MKAMVTGGAGFIGSHIVESLLNDGIEVVSYDDYSAGRRENLAHLQGRALTEVEGDVCDFRNLKAAMEGCHLVFHEAASKKNICDRDPRRDLQVNGLGAYNVFQAALDLKVKKVVHASTGSVYGEPVEFPQNESHPTKPVSWYGVSKLAGESYARVFAKRGLDVTVLRYFHVYGPRQDHGPFGGVVSIFAHNIVNILPIHIFGDGEQNRSFTHVSDVVRINRAMANQRGYEVYNCASGIGVTIRELADTLMELADIEVPVIYEAETPGDIHQFVMDPSKIMSLGFEFEVDFEDGLRSVLDWESTPHERRTIR